MENRRQRLRLKRQIPVRCEQNPGFTINVSMRGARIVTRQAAQKRFLLSLESLQLAAERVWEEPLGGGNRVIGVRFSPSPSQQAVLQDLLAQNQAAAANSPFGFGQFVSLDPA